MIEPMSVKNMAKLIGKCETFFSTEELDKIVYRGVDELLTDGELAMLSGAGYLLPDEDKYNLTTEARAYLKKKYPEETNGIAEKARREVEEIGEYDPDWLGYSPDELDDYTTQSQRRQADEFVHSGILFTDRRGKYRLTAKGEDKARHWLRHALTNRCKFSLGIATSILELAGFKRGEEDKIPYTSPQSWGRVLNNIRKSLSTEEKRALGMFKEAPMLTAVEKRLKRMILRKGSIDGLAV